MNCTINKKLVFFLVSFQIRLNFQTLNRTATKKSTNKIKSQHFTICKQKQKKLWQKKNLEVSFALAFFLSLANWKVYRNFFFIVYKQTSFSFNSNPPKECLSQKCWHLKKIAVLLCKLNQKSFINSSFFLILHFQLFNFSLVKKKNWCWIEISIWIIAINCIFFLKQIWISCR